MKSKIGKYFKTSPLVGGGETKTEGELEDGRRGKEGIRRRNSLVS